MRKTFATLLAIIAPFLMHAQLHPVDGSTLTYRIIGFTFPEVEHATAYQVEIVKGYVDSTSVFEGKTKIITAGKTNRIIGEVPAFAADYTWRPVAMVNGSKQMQNVLYHFRTGTIPSLDSGNTRLRVTRKATRYKDGYVFSDASKVLYDMEGKPIWYLPTIAGVSEPNCVIRDLKRTCKNSITFLANDKPFEIDYNGDLLWRAPKNSLLTNDTIARYHHEVTLLNNGHYMLMGNELLPMKWMHNSAVDSELIPYGERLLSPETKGVLKIGFGTVVELDQYGRLYWFWRSSDFYKKVNFKEPATGRRILDIHENSFAFDERAQTLRVGFKNISEILKVKYPEGNVTNIFGGMFPVEESERYDSFFNEQHACKVTMKGNLLVYNNRMNRLDQPPTVVIFREPENDNEELEKIWEYVYPVSLKKGKRAPLTNGGNVVELPDESIFVSSCTPFGNVFIVGRDKHLAWEAVLEKYDSEKKWMELNQYRASFVTGRKQLEEMIWYNREAATNTKK